MIFFMEGISSFISSTKPKNSGPTNRISLLESFNIKATSGGANLQLTPTVTVLDLKVPYGTFKSRTVTVGVNWRLAPPEVAFILNDSSSEILFVGPEFFGLVEEIKDEIPSIKKIITVGGHHEEWEDYASWRDSQIDEDPMLESKGNDDVIQLYTSGTTGHPKGL